MSILWVGSGSLSWQPAPSAVPRAGPTTLRADRVPLSVTPFNRAELVANAGADVASSFRILDLLVEGRDGGTKVYVARHHWDAAADCVTLRVSAAALPAAAAGGPAAHWDTVHDGRPCLRVGPMRPRGEQADRSGGRLARRRRVCF